MRSLQRRRKERDSSKRPKVKNTCRSAEGRRKREHVNAKSVSERVLAVLYEEVAYIKQLIGPCDDIGRALRALKGLYMSRALYQLPFTRQERIRTIVDAAERSPLIRRYLFPSGEWKEIPEIEEEDGREESQ